MVVGLAREVIQVESVESKILPHLDYQILHTHIDSFSARTSREVLAAIKKARQGPRPLGGVILDLRFNPGGLLDQAVQVADLFLKSGTIVTTKGRREERESADQGYNEVNYPVVILIDRDSASASEIVAGALQDHDRAVVLGQPSFGKGSVQTIFELPSDHALKLTIARYYTPHGHSIQNTGIYPDIWFAPIYKRDENLNLLGSYRHKTEKYLPNHLLGEPGGQKGLRKPHGYYLSEVPDNFSERKVDRLRQMAELLIEQVYRKYGSNLPREGQSAQHWQQIARPSLKRFMQKEDAAVAAWLKREHTVEWRGTAESDGIEFHWEVDEERPRTAGEIVRFKWTIDHRGSQPQGQIFVFISPIDEEVDSVEVLVGSLEPGATKQGFVDFRIPNHWEEEKVQVTAGMGIGANPIVKTVENFRLKVIHRPRPKILSVVSMDNERGGKIPGVLEPEESAQLKVSLKNESQVDARDVKVSLVNLSGEQIALKNKSVELPILRSKSQRIVDINLNGSMDIVHGNLSFGLLIESHDLSEPIARRVLIKGHPTVKGPKTSKAMNERDP